MYAQIDYKMLDSYLAKGNYFVRRIKIGLKRNCKRKQKQ